MNKQRKTVGTSHDDAKQLKTSGTPFKMSAELYDDLYGDNILFAALSAPTAPKSTSADVRVTE